MTTRVEARFGSQIVGTVPVVVAGPVPSGKRWNCSALISNHAASASNLNLVVATGWPTSDDRYKGTAYSNPSAGNPTPQGLVPSPSGRYVAQIGTNTSTQYGLNIYRAIGGLVRVGQYESNSAILCVAWSPDERWIAISTQSTMSVEVYRWDPGSETATSVWSGNVTIGSSTAIFSLEWSANSDYLFIGANATPYIAACPWTASSRTLGSKVSDPGSLPGSAVQAITRNPAGTYVAYATTGSPYINVHAWTGSAWGSKSSNPGTLPGASVYGTAWATDGATLFCTQNTSPWLRAYAFSAGTIGTTYTPSDASASSNAYTVRTDSSGLVFLLTDSTTAVQCWTYSAGFTLKDSYTIGTAATGYYAPHIAAFGGQVVHTLAASPYIGGFPYLASPVFEDREAVLASGVSLAAAARAKYSGFVMNATESLVAWASVADSLDIAVSGVEITL